jgi:hypothetical protein
VREFDLRPARLTTASNPLVGIGLLIELGRRSFDLRTGLMAGARVAVYPNAVAMSRVFNAESNFLVLLLARVG